MASRRNVLARFVAAVADLHAVRTPAGRLCEAARTVSGADGASLTLTQGDAGLERVVLWASDATATRLEAIQDTLGEGPAYDAMRNSIAVDIAAADVPSRWPLFAGLMARDTAVARVSAFPMRAAGAPLGVLQLYLAGSARYAYGARELLELAGIVGVMLVERTPADEPPAASTWGDRSTVNQAVGMVMAQLAASPADALALLRAHAYTDDTTLPEVARHVLDRSLVFRPPEAPEA